MNPAVQYDLIQLPLTRLHYLTMGHGDPLIIVPATISSIDSWLNIVTFMAQKFRVHFFELPGHGGSTPFTSQYSSRLVASTIEQFINRKRYEKVHLMGFSFGGILALTTLAAIPKRINNVILFAPCVSFRALRFSLPRIMLLNAMQKACEKYQVQTLLLYLMHNRHMLPYIYSYLQKAGKVEKTVTDKLDAKLLSLPRSTLQVLVAQIHEILHTEFPFEFHEFPHRCYFGMSVNDPLLDYNVTRTYISKWFPKLTLKSFDVPYHQPPKPLTVRELNDTYGHLLDTLS